MGLEFPVALLLAAAAAATAAMLDDYTQVGFTGGFADVNLE